MGAFFLFTYKKLFLSYLSRKVFMASNKYINIDLPFKDSPQGFLLNLNSDTQRAVKADLMHLLLTRKGQRLYNPNFGTDLIKFIFEPNDRITLDNLKSEISASVKKYLPNLQINTLDINQSPNNQYLATVTLTYTITEGVFAMDDLVIINI